jgi:DNA mismatch endonuclease (patch repair protein)
MSDVHDKKTRSFNMSRIKSKDTQPEILIRKFLFGQGFRYRLYDKALPGKPDLVFPKYKTVWTCPPKNVPLVIRVWI